MSPFSNLAFGNSSDLARAIATSLMSIPTTDRALLKIARGQVAFATTKLENRFVANKSPKTSAQNFVPEA